MTWERPCAPCQAYNASCTHVRLMPQCRVVRNMARRCIPAQVPCTAAAAERARRMRTESTSCPLLLEPERMIRHLEKVPAHQERPHKRPARRSARPDTRSQAHRPQQGGSLRVEPDAFVQTSSWRRAGWLCSLCVSTSTAGLRSTRRLWPIQIRTHVQQQRNEHTNRTPFGVTTGRAMLGPLAFVYCEKSE